VVLDFNRPDPADPQAGPIQAFQRAYLQRIVVPVAGLAGLHDHYAYLEASLQRFPTGPEQERLAGAAGFSAARHLPMALGTMGLLELVA
jgi:demethylmenaquinone methyltransferase/2-methoxy-6-polyprenyl-1,4-benzoquinol methylase